MTAIEISKELYEKLEAIARNENRSIDNVIQSSLSDYVDAHRVANAQQTAPEREAAQIDPLLLIAKAAEELGQESSEGDLSVRSREILNTEFPEYLMNRIRNQDTGDDAEQTTR